MPNGSLILTRFYRLFLAAKRAKQVVDTDSGLNSRIRDFSTHVNSTGNPRVFTCTHLYLLRFTQRNVGIIEIYLLDFSLGTVRSGTPGEIPLHLSPQDLCRMELHQPVDQFGVRANILAF